jgi:tRNA/rRNA methyltransferase
MAKIIFILVEPATPGNIGSSARAVKTMGFNELRLVNPCDYLNNEEAIKLAYSSQDILENAKVFKTLSEAVSDIDFIAGTSAKHRRVKHDYYKADEVPGIMLSKGCMIKKCAIIFGREESGLNNDELKMCDIISYVPMINAYPSLNLSQTVMLYAYEFFKQTRETKEKSDKADTESFKSIQEKTAQMLRKLSVAENMVLFNRIMERISLLSKDDLHLLHSVHKYFLNIK